MKGIIVFFIKTEATLNETYLKKQKETIESLNKDLFKKLREYNYEFMYCPVAYEAGSHVDITFFNDPREIGG